MTRRTSTVVALTLLVATSCGSSGPPAEPAGVDLTAARAGFHCGHGPTGGAIEACQQLDGFAAAGPVRAWPTGSEVQTWLGVDHCVQPTATSEYDTYQLVYLKAGTGSPAPSGVAPGRVLAYAAVFASDQIKPSEMPAAAAALRALAHGQTPDTSTTGDLSQVLPTDGAGAYQTLVRTLDGRAVGNGRADTGTWFLRSDGTHLLLVSPTLQGGCASELHRVPR